MHHPRIPWKTVAGIGNILRHDYETIAAPVLWTLIQNDLPDLEQACRQELIVEMTRTRSEVPKAL